MKSIARKSLAGLMLLAALAVTIRLVAQRQPEGSTSMDAGTANPVPLINQPLAPDTTIPGGPGFTLTVNGTGFVSTSVVKWNGSARTTTFVSKSQLKATILASDIATAHTASLTGVNPGPGGGTSNIVFFPITLPVNFLLGGSVFAAGPAPLSAVTGDFNGDGKLDLAVANLTGTSVSVFLGNGDGTFQAPVNYGTGTNPTSGMVVGDFRDDGKLDLVVANNGSNNVSVLLGNGDGTFQPAVNYDTGTNPTWVAVGDFNRDGKLDLVVSNQNCTQGAPPCGAGTVSILLGNGDGTFQAHADYQTSAEGPNGVAVGDFNNDGILDLAVATGSGGVGNQVSVLLGNGDGTFQSGVNYAAGLNPAAIATADFNKDGKLDLAVVNNIGSVSIILGKGDGTFQNHVDYSTGSFPWGTIGIADFNEDGNLDFAVANAGSNSVSIFLGNGDGTFQAQVQNSTGAQPRGAVIGDFNGDGRLDLAVPNENDNTVSVLLQTGTLSISPPSVNFGAQVLGFHGLPRIVTLTNTGTSTLNISGIAIAGTDPGDFNEANNCGASLPPGGHCTIGITFTPAQLGPRTAALTITDSAPGSPQSVPLNGFGVTSGPNATLSATSLTFAVQLVGTTSPAQPVTLTNYGTMLLDITSIIASGDFSQSNTCGSSLAPLASCTVSVTFTPTQRGTRIGTLSITDNAPGSPQTVSLSGVGTVVELNPPSLSFHCHAGTCPPPPQPTTLTNTGTSTLNISSITITGSQYFSEANNCPSLLMPNGFCTITVHFNPQTLGTFNGAVSVSDNGGGSPQQVALSGTRTKRGMSLAALSALSTTQSAAVPSPTGPSNVGTRVVEMVDPVRDDPFLGNGTKRDLLVRFWYPASISEGCEPAPYTSPAVWSYFSQLTGFSLPEVRTNSCLDAPVTKGPHPVVVFTHGYTGTFTDYTFIAEDLASRGYVVAAVDHTHESTAVEFPDGQFVQSVFGSHLAESTWRRDEQSLSLAVDVRLKDLKFVVDELAHMNGEASGSFAGNLDLTRVAIAGHSLGGLAALLGVKQETRFKAAVLLDAVMSDGSASLTETPMLVLAMGREQWSGEECRLWNDLHGPRFAVNLKGAEHVTPSDAVWLAKGAIKTGPMGSEKTIEALRNYIAAFLDTNLRGKPFDPLLRGPSWDYPDADVTTQKQSLCGETIDH